MAVVMAKSDRARLAYSDYKHLSTDNLSFVAGLRGQPSAPAPASEPTKTRRIHIPEVVGEEDNESPVDDDDSCSRETPATARQACPSRTCAPRAEELEVLMEGRVVAQIARHRAQSKLVSARERSLEAESKLEEAKAELIRMSKSIIEGEERTDVLRDGLRDEGSIIKTYAEELDSGLKEVQSLRRAAAVDTSLPHPNAHALSVQSDLFDDGLSLQPPVPSPTGAAINGREWIHSGQLGQYTHTSTRPPRSNGLPNTPHHHLSSRVSRNNDSDAPVPPQHENRQKASVSASSFLEEEGAATERERNGPSDAWSCCARSVETAGRGCEPREPVATPEDLLLDTIDPRSRQGRPLDFRKFLPRIAWIGLNPDPVVALFAGSASEGTLRPHTAPERLGPGQRAYWHDSDEAPPTRGGGTGQGRVTYHNNNSSSSSSSSSNGNSTRTGEIFGTSANSGVKPWWREGEERSTSTGRRRDNSSGISTDKKVVPKRHEFLRKPSPANKPGVCHHHAAGRQGGGSLPLRARQRGGTTGNRNDGSGGCIRGRGGVAGTNSVDDECCPRTQILGMNAGRFPREVRQAPLDRPLTAPCAKVGRRRVRMRGGSRAGPGRP